MWDTDHTCCSFSYKLGQLHRTWTKLPTQITSRFSRVWV